MPETQPVSKVDIALASAAPHAIAVARGPGNIPLFDSNLKWDSATRKQTLNGQPSGTGGDRWVCLADTSATLVKVDKDGVQCHDLTAIYTPQFKQVQPKLIDPNYPVNFNISCSSHDFGVSINNVLSLGWNDLAGGPQTPGYVVMRDAWENHYLQSGRYQNERHVGATAYADDTGREIRPITISVAYKTEEGTPLDPMLTHRTDTWSTLVHLTEEGTQRQKWEWFPLTQEWNQFSPGSAVYLSPTVCSATHGENGRTTQLKLIGSDVKLSLAFNGVEKHSIRSVNDYLYITGPSGGLAYWTNTGEFNLQSGPKISVSAADAIVARWFNTSAPSGAGDWAWFVSNTGRARLTNLTSGLSSLMTESGKLGFYGTAPTSKPTISGSRADGTALQNLLTALQNLGLITDSTTT